MRKNATEFRQRFARQKNGEQVYKAGLPHYEDGKDAEIVTNYHDSRGNEDVTPSQINKLRTKYPKLRPLLKTKDDPFASNDDKPKIHPLHAEDGLDDTISALISGGVGLIPIVGSIQDAMEMAKNPSWENLGFFGLSTLGDILLLSGIGGAPGAALKAARVAAKSRKAALALRNTTHVARYSAKSAEIARDMKNARKLAEKQLLTNVLPEVEQTRQKINNITE